GVGRGAPLPNSVRCSAAMRTSGTVVTPLVRKIWRRREMLARGPRAGPGQAAALQTKTRTQARWAESLAGRGHTRACAPTPGADRRRHGCGAPAAPAWAGRGAVEHLGQLDARPAGSRRGAHVRAGQLGAYPTGSRDLVARNSPARSNTNRLQLRPRVARACNPGP